jgi:hypothetical protein
MSDDIEKIMNALAKNHNKLIVNPDTLEELKARGIPFNVIPSQTIEEMFEQRKLIAFEKAPQLPSLPQGLPPAIQALYQEIRECIFFGLYGAAITMSTILIEFTLKHATYIKEAGGYQKAVPGEWDEFENMELSTAINRAKKAGIIDSKMSKKLHSFRVTIRNPYNHYNIKKITKNVVAKGVKEVDVNTCEVKEVDLAAKDNPMIQTQAKPFMDEYHVMAVFYFADEVVKNLLLNK